MALSHDGRYLARTVNHNGYSTLQIRDLTTKRSIAPQLPRGVYQVARAEHAPVLMVRVTGPQIAGDVWAIDFRTGRATRVTRSSTAGLDPRRLAVPKAVTFKSWDVEAIHGLLYLPTNPRYVSGAPAHLDSLRGTVLGSVQGAMCLAS